MNNIESFPKKNPRINIEETPLTQKEFDERINSINTSYYDVVSDKILDTVMHQLSVLGFGIDPSIDFNDENTHLKMLAFLREAICGVVCAAQGQDHAVHGVVDKCFENTVRENKETGVTYHSYRFKGE
jgi:hypothetical protein